MAALKDGQGLTWQKVPDRGRGMCEGPSQNEELKSIQHGWSITGERQ